MSVLVTFFLFVLVLATATLSGVFGMAGGLVLMGGLTLVLPVNAAMVTHGGVQIVSNGWRAILHRMHVKWSILGVYALGSISAALLLLAVSYSPSEAFVLLMLGLVPGLVWLPKGWIEMDAAKPTHSAIAGFVVTGLSLIAGVSGPLLDIFFVRTGLTRHQIVATKAAAQVFAHGFKILFYGAPFFLGHAAGLPPWWFFAIAAVLAMIGAILGGKILDRMSDVNFLKYTKWIVTVIGVVYLVRAIVLISQGQVS